ncbi:hypothetical protein [Aquimarina sp. AU474]|uniref:hypothetical protein n=1 Tax=Aquimarina sp. AU474 TaxID=2108529 RepID=UPI001F20EB37|nr:hypothetical protein [Aquimarina sp. AU474]
MSIHQLTSSDPLTRDMIAKGIQDWQALLTYVQQIPYGRNASRTDVSLVISEHQGTCSSKHALLKTIADHNMIAVDLVMGMYKMNQKNTPKIGTILTEHHLEYIPEAHCYVRKGSLTIDVTSPQSDFDRIKNDILLEQIITPDQVGRYKIDFHKNYIKEWIKKEELDFSFDAIWAIRESCIKNLST